jgi:hypothetical protein
VKRLMLATVFAPRRSMPGEVCDGVFGACRPIPSDRHAQFSSCTVSPARMLRDLPCEAKPGKRDRIRPSQQLFAETALDIGLPLDSFLFVEWTTA